MKRLLFVAHRLPYPPDKGERLRAYHEIRALAERFDVTVAALCHNEQDRANAAGLAPHCAALLTAGAGGLRGLLRGGRRLATGGSLTEGYFASRSLASRICRAGGEAPFDVALGYCSSTFPYLRRASAGAFALDLVDVDSAKWREYARRARGPKAWLYAVESRRVERLERRILDACGAVFVVSEQETAPLRPAANLLAVSNGVDSAYFSPGGEQDSASKPGGLVFTGTMDYRPNVDAVCGFVREAWGELKRRWAELTFTIVGRDPAPAVRALEREDGIRVTGAVDDVRPHVRAASVSVAPLRIARGIQNKVLEAMAMGKAVVASGAALEGIEAQVGRNVLRADAPEEWVERIDGLLGDPTRRAAMGQAAREWICTRYGWPARLAPLVDACERLAAEERPR